MRKIGKENARQLFTPDACPLTRSGMLRKEK